tara:strand:- start:118 stop:654 length:537 start_codon:yes stop_codon:yes gene_type:complete
MNDLASLLKSIDIPDLNRTIEKGTVISIKDDIAEKFIKDRNNNPPFFVTKEFRQRSVEKKGYSANEHYWIFLKTYQKRGRSGKVKIVNRSSMKNEQSNRKPGDYHQIEHLSIDPDHSRCKIDKVGLWKSELPRDQKLDKQYLNDFGPVSEDYVCIDPQAEKIAHHFLNLERKEYETYD